MNKQSMRQLLMCCMMGVALIVSSCSSEEELPSDGKGFVFMDMNVVADFEVKARAVDLAEYQNKNKYTVQILKEGADAPLHEYRYAEIPEGIEMDNGTYILKAFYGTDFTTSSRTNLYVEGIQNFSVNSDDQRVTVNCTPTAAKASVNFDPSMDTYFSDYWVSYETAALKAESATAVWAKGDAAPWYLKVNKEGEVVKATIHFTRKAEYGSVASGTVEKTHTLLPNKSWTLNIIPKYDPATGQLGFTITIDESTNDHEMEIEVPSEWIG